MTRALPALLLCLLPACTLYFDDRRGPEGGDDVVVADPEPDAAVPGDEGTCGRPHPGPVDEPGECDPVAQTGCTGGEKCTITVFGIPGCAPAGDANVGRDCTTSPDDCAPGTFCTTEEFDAAEGICLQFCIPSNRDCGCGKSCAFNPPFETYDYGVCAPPCDPLVQACTGGRACYLDDYGNTSCVLPWREGGQDESCFIFESCGVGLTCLGGTCKAFCDVTDAAACGPDHRCAPAADVVSTVEADDGLGVCVPR